QSCCLSDSGQPRADSVVIDRRDFLLLRRAGEPLELSGERLYMRFVDAQADGSVERLLDGLARELEAARALRVTGGGCLAGGGLGARVEPLLERFVAAGGRIV